MALVVSPSTTLSEQPDPTAALQAALDSFEKVLSVEQRKQFHTHVQSFNQQRPDTSSVIQFVAQIDAESHTTTRRSVSHRLVTFLDATRQFTDIVDTFISSHPAVAALLWGGVKTVILTASNVASYFDKVTSMMMAIGKMCPIYQEFSHLYKDSIALQTALCEYYVIIVRLVTRVVEVSQRPLVNGILASIVAPFESEFGVFQNQLDEASRVVKLQISLAAKQAAQASIRLAELESVENRHHRRFVRRFASEISAESEATRQMRTQDSARRAAKSKSYIRNQLSTINHTVSWKHARKQRLVDTAECFCHEQAFQAWEADPRPVTLWCPGRMGVGKTVLVSSIIEYLYRSLQIGDVVSYHFCRYDDSASLSARNIVGTLARQILDKYIEAAHGDQLHDLLDACHDLDPDEITALILPRLQKAKKYYVIVDGLDECEQDQITILAKNLVRLCKASKHSIKILCSGRPELEPQLFRDSEPDHRLPLSRASVSTDVERYIDAELDTCLQEQSIKLINPEAIWRIKDVLCAEHDGLFLFVRLFIEEIRSLGSESTVLKALEQPPRTISDLLSKKVQRVQSHDLVLEAVKILRYCGCTKRPLTVDEFGELLSLSVSQTSFDRTSVPQNMDRIIAACCGLIYVEEEELTVHYVHNSVKRHLFTDPKSRRPEFVESETDMHLGELCLTYLTFNDFKRDLIKFNASSSTPVAPIKMGLPAAQGSNGIVNGFARKLLRAHRPSRQLTAAELTRRVEDILGENESARLKAVQQSQPFHMLDYAQTHWIWHTSRFEDGMPMWHTFSACVRGDNNLAQRPWLQESSLQSASERTSLPSTAWALRHDHTALLLENVLHKPWIPSIEQGTEIVQHATTIVSSRLMRAVLHHRDLDVHIAQGALAFAAGSGREDLLDLCIDAGADVDWSIELVDRAQLELRWPTYSALSQALEQGPISLSRRLLIADLVGNAQFGVSTTTALKVAAENGHVTVVERLLTLGVYVNTATTDGCAISALHLAAGNGHLTVVERLLTAGADGNASTARSGFRPLHLAAEKGHLAVVERLLAAGVHINAATTDGGLTALHLAAEKGHLTVVERLLAAGVNINIPNAEGRTITALQLAAGRGHLAIVDRLITAGANVDDLTTTLGGSRLTAVQLAGCNSHFAVVRRLTDAGASKVNSIVFDPHLVEEHFEEVERLLMIGRDYVVWHSYLYRR